ARAALHGGQLLVKAEALNHLHVKRTERVKVAFRADKDQVLHVTVRACRGDEPVAFGQRVAAFGERRLAAQLKADAGLIPEADGGRLTDLLQPAVLLAELLGDGERGFRKSALIRDAGVPVCGPADDRAVCNTEGAGAARGR